METNRTFVAEELVRSKELFDRIEARPLTEEQRKAVVIDEDRNLVVAAAGSGKTSVIVAKAGWLVQRGCRHPKDLLLLAFATDARREMEERIHKRLSGDVARNISVQTFHSLGMAIIGKTEGRKPTLARSAEDIRAFTDQLKSIVSDLYRDRGFADLLRTWFQSLSVPYRSEHEFENMGEYYDYIRQHDIRSLNGEKVKSYEECEIANFLYLNGVPYAYEAPYEHDTATSDRRQYKPDFHLPQAGVYIEHFGINAAGNPAPFIDRDEYLQGMEWKRQVHQQHDTILIETFSHEHASGVLFRNLARKLAEHDVTMSPISSDRVFAVLEEQGRISPFIQLVATFLQHYKGAQILLQELDSRAAKLGDRQRAEAFLALFGRIYGRYQEMLSADGEIDFHDMIIKATEHVAAGRCQLPYSYILVDEFQDISPGRAKLLKALLDQSPTAKLLAVGDDWQAIFRFAGSEIAVMREFREHFGNTERVALETTFRCSSPIAALATDFILKNPSQINKTVRAKRQMAGPGVHIGFPGEENKPLLQQALDRIAVDAARQSETSTVLMLGRYRHVRPQNMAGLKRQYPGLEISFMTVHGSKGLEADYIIVLGLCAGKYGFPSEITDDPLLDLVLAAPEAHPNSEERRLFYVALTRARQHVFLLADDASPSPFVSELIEGSYDVTVFGRMAEADVPCPLCVKGRLKQRRNSASGSVFYGCSNWPYCKHTQSSCPACEDGLPIKTDGVIQCRDCGQTIQVCPECDGWLVTRRGRYGSFLGCLRYPACNFTQNIQNQGERPSEMPDNP